MSVSMRMGQSSRTSALFAAVCLLYLLSMGMLPVQVSALLKILPILFLGYLILKSDLGSLGMHLLAALVFSIGGDVLLESGYFVPGLVSFLLAQLTYSSLFLRRFSSWSLRPQVSTLVLVFALLMAFLLWGGAGELRVPVVIYLAVIAFMALSANASLVEGAVVGALIFMFSDVVIAIDRFLLPVPLSGWLVMVSYYLAQWCLVASIIRSRKQELVLPSIPDKIIPPA